MVYLKYKKLRRKPVLERNIKSWLTNSPKIFKLKIQPPTAHGLPRRKLRTLPRRKRTLRKAMPATPRSIAVRASRLFTRHILTPLIASNQPTAKTIYPRFLKGTKMNYIVRRNTVVLATTDSLATVKHLFWLHAHGNKNAVVSVREASPTGLGTCLAEHTGGRSAGFNNLDK